MNTRRRDRDFNSLSLRDLLNARDLYHYHLMNKPNVVGTAVGLYLIRNTDPWPHPQLTVKQITVQIAEDAKTKPKEPRTFDNSNIREYSWPCILVMVREWIREEDFLPHSGLDPAEMVPKTLYLPDGRRVPVCVVWTPPVEAAAPLLPDWHWPEGTYAPGTPVEVHVQGDRHIATIGCLVTNGHTLFALTNQHVTGQEGEPIYARARGKLVEIGKASDRSLTREDFNKVYPDLPLRKTWINLDVGLIEVNDAREWTSELFTVGKIGPLADFAEHNLGTHLINRKVRAHAAASGLVDSEIKALFYRYRSVGGYEYVADYLIASPQGQEKVQTRPGDSGAVWHLMPEEDEKDQRPRPLAVQWGGQAILAVGGEAHFQFALATSLSSACKLLDVELVQCHNEGAIPFWGQMGHYSIGAIACDAMPAGKAQDLMKANRARVGFTLGELDPAKIKDALKEARENDGFVPLADVPDIIWKTHEKDGLGGRDNRFAGKGRTTGPEHPTHYADIDMPNANGETLIQLSIDDPAQNLTVDAWRGFYDSIGKTQSRDRGLLPFRVWQFFDAMVDAASKGKADRFVAAAGLLSHYVGDACQPLHGSMLADGYADQETEVEVNHRNGETEMVKSHEGAGVHSTYETAMIDRYSEEIVTGIRAKLGNHGIPALATSGFEAALATIELMARTAKKIPPTKLVDAYIAAGGTKRVAVQDKLWTKFGDDTCEVMADGARVLAMLWAAAWAKGNGDGKVAAGAIKAIAPSRLKALYTDSDFVPSLDLDNIKAVLK